MHHGVNTHLYTSWNTHNTTTTATTTDDDDDNDKLLKGSRPSSAIKCIQNKPRLLETVLFIKINKTR